jgi:hypothetical protein
VVGLVKELEVDETKPWYLSGTIWGIMAAGLGAFAPRVAQALGTNAGSQTDTLVGIASGAVTLVASVYAIYKRFTATAVLTAGSDNVKPQI